jgi:hypothetical protein
MEFELDCKLPDAADHNPLPRNYCGGPNNVALRVAALMAFNLKIAAG